MELEKIKELIDMMQAHDLTELEIVDGQTRIVLKRGAGPAATAAIIAASEVIAAKPNHAAEAGGAPCGPAGQSEKSEDETLLKIVAPIVGTFYATASPDADPFVETGSRVQNDSIVCIIEAMKVMNEIKSELTGTIKKVLVENGTAVEYGQALFLVEPD